MNKTLIFLLKLVAMIAILGFVGWKLYDAWKSVNDAQLHVDWVFGGLAVVTFAGSMLTSGCTWRWLAYRMGDRTSTFPLLGAYTFSQMGKYIPGKVMLLLMRIERTSRLGMDPQVCVVSTLIENAMYMVSGGLVAVITVVIYLRDKPLYALPVAAGLMALACVFHPNIFYRLINTGLRRMKRPEVPVEQRLHVPDLLLAVAFFLPCWVFGGLSLWCATRSITMIDSQHLLVMPGAYALAVTGGMASLFPGGLGPNEGIKTLFLLPMLGNNAKAALLAVGVQRLAQVLVEVVLGTAGAGLTSLRRK